MVVRVSGRWQRPNQTSRSPTPVREWPVVAGADDVRRRSIWLCVGVIVHVGPLLGLISDELGEVANELCSSGPEGYNIDLLRNASRNHREAKQGKSISPSSNSR